MPLVMMTEGQINSYKYNAFLISLQLPESQGHLTGEEKNALLERGEEIVKSRYPNVMSPVVGVSEENNRILNIGFAFSDQKPRKVSKKANDDLLRLTVNDAIVFEKLRVFSIPNNERSSETPYSMDVLSKYITGNVSENGDTFVAVKKIARRPHSGTRGGGTYALVCEAYDICLWNIQLAEKVERGHASAEEKKRYYRKIWDFI